ncbi:hypothetical protein EVI01_08050 [Enterococcus villorum]|uniref:Uncharacterized protein n=1 Tax=Enterococcus villorum TaxID=112904 RepID=A0A511J0C1_9ENTE|nr:hypothetical protein EVI01_08050 [Enterococcus villorum]
MINRNLKKEGQKRLENSSLKKEEEMNYWVISDELDGMDLDSFAST